MNPNMDAETPNVEEPESRLEALLTRGLEKPEDEDSEVKPAEDAPKEEAVAVEKPADTVEVEIDGKMITVPQDIKESLLRRDEALKQVEEVAQTRQLLQFEKQAIHAQKQIESQLSDDILNVRMLASQLQKYDNIDLASLAANDPATAVRVQAEKEGIRTQLGNAQAQLQDKAAQLRNIEAQRANVSLHQSNKEIRKFAPDWDDPKVQQGVIDAIKGLGVSGEEISQYFNDPNSLLNYPPVMKAAYIVAKWNALQASKPAITNKVAAVTKTLSPKGQTAQDSTTANVSQLKQTLRKSGSTDDAIELLLAKGLKRK